MKIVAVCGMGIGTSVMLKINIENALQELGIDADVEASDISTAKGAAGNADLVLTSEELAHDLAGLDCPVVVVNNFFDNDEVIAKLRDNI